MWEAGSNLSPFCFQFLGDVGSGSSSDILELIHLTLPHSLLLLLPQKSAVRDQRSKSLKCGFSESFYCRGCVLF